MPRRPVRMPMPLAAWLCTCAYMQRVPAGCGIALIRTQWQRPLHGSKSDAAPGWYPVAHAPPAPPRPPQVRACADRAAASGVANPKPFDLVGLQYCAIDTTVRHCYAAPCRATPATACSLAALAASLPRRWRLHRLSRRRMHSCPLRPRCRCPASLLPSGYCSSSHVDCIILLLFQNVPGEYLPSASAWPYTQSHAVGRAVCTKCHLMMRSLGTLRAAPGARRVPHQLQPAVAVGRGAARVQVGACVRGAGQGGSAGNAGLV